MEHYFNVRESLVGLMLIVDSRRGLGAQDAAMLEWVLARDRFAHVLLTKADKLNRRDSQRVLRETAAACADTCGDRATVLGARQARDRRGARGDGPLAGRVAQKKAPVVACEQPPRQTNPAWG